MKMVNLPIEDGIDTPKASELKIEIETKLKAEQLKKFVDKPSNPPADRSRVSIFKTLN